MHKQSSSKKRKTQIHVDRMMEDRDLTESTLPVFTFSIQPPSAAAAQPLQEDVDVGEDDKGRG